jgi:hypothetical protein
MDLELISTHEAGHAVAHYSFGHPLQYAEAREDRGGVRLVPLIGPASWDAQTEERTEQEIVATLAGPMATRVLLGRSHPEGEKLDFDSIQEICKQRGWEETSRLAALERRTCELITAWEPSIRGLAAELLRVSRLDSRRLVEIIEATSGRAPVSLNWGQHGVEPGLR